MSLLHAEISRFNLHLGRVAISPVCFRHVFELHILFLIMNVSTFLNTPLNAIANTLSHLSTNIQKHVGVIIIIIIVIIINNHNHNHYQEHNRCCCHPHNYQCCRYHVLIVILIIVDLIVVKTASSSLSR